MSERFGKDRRIRRRTEFLRVQRQGIGSRAEHFVAIVMPTGEPRPARLGIVASRRVGGAVRRNRGKRLVREWFRRRRLSEGLDLVVILRPGAPDLGGHAAGRELDAVLQRALHRAGGVRRRSTR